MPVCDCHWQGIGIGTPPLAIGRSLLCVTTYNMGSFFRPCFPAQAVILSALLTSLDISMDHGPKHHRVKGHGEMCQWTLAWACLARE
jgi:hypothetical protein